MNPKIFTVLKDGQKLSYDVILTFKSRKTNKNYVVYTDNTYDDDNKLKVFAAIYNPYDFSYIEDVKNNEEWIEINKLLENIL